MRLTPLLGVSALTACTMLNPDFGTDETLGTSGSGGSQTTLASDATQTGPATGAATATGNSSNAAGGDDRGETGTETGGPNVRDFCPARGPGDRDTTTIDTGTRLADAIAAAPPGSAVLLKPGTYSLSGADRIDIDTPGLFVGSTTDRASDVIIDANYTLDEIIRIQASEVVLANFTIQHSTSNAIRVLAPDTSNLSGIVLYNLTIVDALDQSIKVQPSGNTTYADDGLLACSTLMMTAQGRERADANGCSAAGFHARGGTRWSIRDNLFSGIWCPSNLGQFSVGVAGGGGEVTIERNVIVDPGRGIGLGQTPGADVRQLDTRSCGVGEDLELYGGTVQNNTIIATDPTLVGSHGGFEEGIAAWSTCGVDILHNTIIAREAPYSSIEYRWSTEEIRIINNLATHNLRQREDAEARTAGNYFDVPIATFDLSKSGTARLHHDVAPDYVGIDTLLHLTPFDFEGDQRWAPHAGADEVVVP